jgi:methyl-accepting chemotaxis protein
MKEIKHETKKKHKEGIGFLGRISITRRILLVVVLLCLAYPFLLVLLIQEQNRAVDFAAKEILGSDYLAQSTPHLVEIVRRDVAGNTPPAIPDGLQAIHDRGGAELLANEDFKALTEANQSALDPAMDLNKRVGDESNLILDPDLDSYYLMDIVLLRVPDLLVITRNLEIAHQSENELQQQTQRTLFRDNLRGIERSIETAFEQNQKTQEILSEDYRTFKGAANRYLNERGGQETERWLSAINAFFLPTNAEMRRLLEVRISGFRAEQAFKLATVAVVMLLAFLVLWRVVTSIVRPIRSLEDRMQDLSEGQGDLTIRLQSSQTNELGRAAGHFNVFAERLQSSITGLAHTAAKLDENGAHSRERIEIINGGLQEQAATLEEVSAAMEEISASADRVNDSVEKEKSNLRALKSSMETLRGLSDKIQTDLRRGSQETTALAQSAREGTDEMQEASAEMQAIVNTTTEMSGIGDEIQEIAERINLLALNASIEAARAGDAGRGFAVVATEVSRLADQTNESISRISQMMQDNRERVEASTHVIEQAVTRALSLSQGVLDLRSSLVALAEELPAQERIQKEAGENLTTLEEQARVVDSIVREQKLALQEATESISSVNRTAQNHAEASRQLIELSRGTVEMAGELRLKSQEFKTEAS